MDIYEDMINKNPLKTEEGHIEINSKGHLMFCGKDTAELAEKYGTPLFIFNEDKIRKNFINMKKAFQKYYDKIEICFAFKSNSLISILKVLKEEGAYADVVSGGEYFKAETAGFSNAKIVFNGNNKLKEEIAISVKNGSLLNVDSFCELENIIEESKNLNKKANISIRVNPNIPTSVIDEFSTGVKKSKFGIDLDNGDAFKAYEMAVKSGMCNVLGIHVHIGSQVVKSGFYKYSAEKIMDFCGKLKKELGIQLKYVNMGGGFAIPFEYLDECDKIEDFAKIIGATIKQKVLEHNLDIPIIFVEPGGSIIGNTAILLSEVGTLKEKENKILAAINIGGDILLRATQGWYTYRAVCANKMNKKNSILYDLVGPLCYEGDITARDRFLPKLEIGDIIAFIDVGAYTVSLMNHYNCRLFPEILMVREGKSETVIKKRETYEDLIAAE